MTEEAQIAVFLCTRDGREVYLVVGQLQFASRR